MDIDAVELLRLRLPMLAPFRSGAVELFERDLLLLRVDARDDHGGAVTGWGESAALTGTTYGTEDVDSVVEVLRRRTVPALLEGVPPDDATSPMAAAVVRTALLDAGLRAQETSLGRRLGVERRRVEAGVAVGFTDTIDDLVDEVAGHVATGYRRVKVKIRPGWDVTPLHTLRAAFPALGLQADANGGYGRDQTDALAALDGLHLLCIEQPLAEHDLAGHAELSGRIGTPVCLDESIASFSAAVHAIEMGACAVVCVKPGRLGGVDAAVAVHDLCVGRGVAAWCGGMLETGIGRSSLLALAALPGFTLPGDLSATGRWYVDDLTPPVALDDDGCLAVPDGLGVGPPPDLDSIDRYTTWRETITAGRS